MPNAAIKLHDITGDHAPSSLPSGRETLEDIPELEARGHLHTFQDSTQGMRTAAKPEIARSSAGLAIGKKMPSSQKPAEPDLDGASSSFDDVVFLRLPDVKALTGLSKTSLYALIKEKNFPAPVRLGPRAVAWVKSEIRQWAVERVRASRSVA
jgi:prophage regulatory protein